MKKYIVTHEAAGTSFCNGYIVANHCSNSFATFSLLVEEARKSFDVKDDDIECGTVKHSRFYKGCPIIRFPLPVGSQAEGWTNCDYLPDIR